MSEPIRLTQFAKGAGCGCKISPAILEDILGKNRTSFIQKNLLVGNHTKDDCAVYDLQNGNVLMVTADFFMPIVDDPYTFGKAAAANALSDIYAMGGKPITAIALLGWPIDKIPAEYAAQVMAGATSICEQIGLIISGGHTIDSPEPFFGLSVNGMAELKNLKQNNTAKKGDVILMSKPLGIGILATAMKRGLLEKEHETAFIAQLTALNEIGTLLGAEQSVHAMTDITGFGLIGHLNEMSDGSGLTAHVNYSQIPKMEAALYYIAQGILPDATYRNWNAYAHTINISPTIDAMQSFALLPDPQTNGGLLISVDPLEVDQIIALGKAHNALLCPIGVFKDRREKWIEIE